MFNCWYRQYGKRLFDLVLVALSIIVMLPVMVVVALLVVFKLGRPIFFRQQRPGWRGKPFTIYKFRSMTEARDVEGNLLPVAVRLTPFGRFLRSSSLDELPELFNVLKGDMSLVGPRPLLMSYLERYTPEQARRHMVRPGLTGWNQINGRVNVEWDTRLAMDVWYVDNLSLWLDLKILVWTPLAVFSRQGINRDGYATGPEFMGVLESKKRADPQPIPMIK